MPARIEFAMPADARAISVLPKSLQTIQRGFHFHLIANDTSIVLHNILQILLDFVRIFPVASLKWRDCFARDNLDSFIVSFAVLVFPRKFGGEFSSAFSEDDNVGEGIAAEAIGAVNTGSTFTGRE